MESNKYHGKTATTNKPASNTNHSPPEKRPFLMSAALIALLSGGLYLYIKPLAFLHADHNANKLTKTGVNTKPTPAANTQLAKTARSEQRSKIHKVPVKTNETATRTVTEKTDTPWWAVIISNDKSTETKSPPVSKATAASANVPSFRPRAEPPIPRLTISGRVLDRNGYPVAGAAIHGVCENLFNADPTQASSSNEQSTRTDANGNYTIRGLDDGQYRLSAGDEAYAKAEMVVRAGVKHADFVLEREKKLHIYGVITGKSRRPLTGVQIIPNVSPAVAELSNNKGQYAVTIRLRESVENVQLRFEQQGYNPKIYTLDDTASKNPKGKQLNVNMLALNTNTAVYGILRSSAGEFIPGETIVLYSPSLRQRYEAISDGNGRFAATELAAAEDYLIAVRPVGPYQDYNQSNLRIVEPMEYDVVLEPQSTGRLIGKLTDPKGNPLPNFALSMHSETATGRNQQVIGDEGGNFVLSDVPYGGLVFETYSQPYFRISNVQLQPDRDEIPIPLVIDWGNHVIQGKIIDNTGAPLAVPEVAISWLNESNGIRSTSLRRSASDANGNFQFSNLGSGRHMITVNAPGFQTTQLAHEVGSAGNAIVVQMEAAGSGDAM